MSDIWSIEDEHVAAALGAMEIHAVHTPLTPVPTLGQRVWIKWESEQRTGSFKVRGALAKLSSLSPEERAKGVVAASAGNHGMGVAFAARALGMQATIYVPKTTPEVKRRGILDLGADLVVADLEGYDATEARAREIATERDAVFISPYDDPYIAAGNGVTIGYEILDQIAKVATIVVPVGGGGLLAGLAEACRRRERQVELVGVQSEASAGMYRSLAEDRAIETLEPAQTLAEGLEGGVSPSTFEHAKRAGVKMELVTEEEIRQAMVFSKNQLGRVIEGSGAVSIAWARRQEDSTGDAIVLLVTGANVD